MANDTEKVYRAGQQTQHRSDTLAVIFQEKWRKSMISINVVVGISGDRRRSE